MNLRTATIWTTGVMFLVALAAPYFILPSLEELFPLDFSTVGGIAAIFLFVGLPTGSPMAVSFFLARKIKHDTPALLLLASTIAFIPLFGISYATAFSGLDNYVSVPRMTYSVIHGENRSCDRWRSAPVINHQYSL